MFAALTRRWITVTNEAEQIRSRTVFKTKKGRTVDRTLQQWESMPVSSFKCNKYGRRESDLGDFLWLSVDMFALY